MLVVLWLPCTPRVGVVFGVCRPFFAWIEQICPRIGLLGPPPPPPPPQYAIIFSIHILWLFGNTILLQTLQNLLSFSHLTHITFEIILDWFYYNTKTHEWGKKASV